MTQLDLPLFELFTRLREADLPLGIDDYLLLLRALQGGFGLIDKDALVRLCRTLWVKSADDGHIFDYHFEQVWMTITAKDFDTETAHIPEMHKTTSTVESLQRSQAPISGQTNISEPLLEVEDDIRVAQILSQAASQDDSAYSQFIQTDEYLPVTRRQMKQSWRHYRRHVREGPLTELDIETTVKMIGRQGLLFDTVLVPRTVNRATLLLLVDQGGSMAPFHVLSRRLVETAERGGRLGKAGAYYFHNCPVDYLYRDPSHHKAESIDKVLTMQLDEQTSILIISDAGAARGRINLERALLTKEFVRTFRARFRHIAWLNPVPGKRWLGTTAGEIMQFVPMFDVSRAGLEGAINVLRGRASRFANMPRHVFHE